MKNKKFREPNARAIRFSMTAVIIVLIAALSVSVAVFIKQKNDLRNRPVLYVGEEGVTQSEYQFFYMMLVNNFVSIYGDYTDSIGLDISKPLSQQECGLPEETGTWDDFFKSATNDLLNERIPLYRQALEDKQFTYDINKEYQSFEKSINNLANSRGMTKSQLYHNMLGKYADSRSVKEAFQKFSISNLYMAHLRDRHIVTEDEITEYYDNHKKDFDSVTYRQFTIFADDSDEEMKEVEKKASDFYSRVYDEETFKSLCIEFSVNEEEKNSYEKEDASLRTSLYSEIGIKDVAEWLFSDSKEEKATVMIKDDSNHCYYIIYFISRERDESNTVDFRHILISTDGNTNAKDEAQRIYSEWKNGDASEESFELLANEHSDDAGSSDRGGSYFSVERGQMVESVDEWIFADERQYGDSDIIQSEYGYHIMFFKDKREPKWKINIKNTKKQEYIDSYLEELRTSNPLKYVD